MFVPISYFTSYPGYPSCRIRAHNLEENIRWFARRIDVSKPAYMLPNYNIALESMHKHNVSTQPEQKEVVETTGRQ
jgi:hypothetical protein